MLTLNEKRRNKISAVYVRIHPGRDSGVGWVCDIDGYGSDVVTCHNLTDVVESVFNYLQQHGKNMWHTEIIYTIR